MNVLLIQIQSPPFAYLQKEGFVYGWMYIVD